MSIHFQSETFDAWLADAGEALKAHWQEAASFIDKREMDIATEIFRNLDRGGRLIVITARDDGRLVGYIIAIVAPNLHSQKTLMSTVDAYWMEPKYRGGFVTLVRRYMAAADAKGAKLKGFRQKIRPDGERVPPDRLLEVLGFRQVEVGWYRCDP